MDGSGPMGGPAPEAVMADGGDGPLAPGMAAGAGTAGGQGGAGGGLWRTA
jgi:hypothetical protein